MQFSHPLPESDEDEDYIDTGAAILNFYCTLVDLLGRCAPDAGVIALVSTTAPLYLIAPLIAGVNAISEVKQTLTWQFLDC